MRSNLFSAEDGRFIRVLRAQKNARAEARALSVLSVLGTVLGEAFTAVHGPISTGLEGHLGGAAAAVADHFVHLAFTAVATVLTAGGAAGGAAAGLVLEALVSVELLLGQIGRASCRERV